MQILRMAWRNLWRNGRRSAVTVAAMTFALWVMILYTGLVEGMLVDMVDQAVDLEVGELQVVAAGYRDDPSLHRVVADPAALLTGIEGLGYAAAPRLLGGGLGAVGQESAGVQLVGVDVERDATVTRIHQRLDQGAWLDPADPRGVVLGKRVARSLGAQVGAELLILSQGADGSIANDLFTVRGVLAGVGDGVDRGTVFLTEDAFRALMVLPAGAHRLTVRVPEGSDLDQARARIEALGPGLEVRTWRQLLPTLSTMIESTRGLIQVVAFIVYLAIAILVLNAMLMAVFERIREFGVMKAIGYGPGTVFSLIAVESALQALLATGIGVLLALPAMAWLSRVGIDVGALGGMQMMGMSMMQRWTGRFTVSTVQGPVLILWGMVALAVLWPALKAARIPPIEAMRAR